MKRAFVLSGGGAKGAFQVGAMKEILAAGINPDFITANSAGALNATGLSFGSIQELEAVWRSIKSRDDIFSDNLFTYLKVLFNSPAIWDSRPLKKKIDTFVKGRKPKIPFWVNTVDLITGELVHCKALGTSQFAKEVLASASIPVLVPPVDGHLVDGGIRNNTPLKLAIDEGADEIFVFMGSPMHDYMARTLAPKNIIEVATRSLEIIQDEATRDDIKMCLKYNAEGRGRYIRLHYIAPKTEVIGTLDFDQKKISNAISLGQMVAIKYLLDLEEQEMNNVKASETVHN